MTKQTRLFVACIVALVAVAFGFVIRAFLLNEWGVLFNLSETQKGSIQGAGLYPQALSIIFFSLIIDRFGYGRTIAFAFCAHVVSAIITVTATGYSLPGHTATGLPVGPGIVAVDPSVIPLGTRMTIPGYGEGVAADTGSAVQGLTIDLWFPTLADALAWGRRTVTITLH